MSNIAAMRRSCFRLPAADGCRLRDAMRARSTARAARRRRLPLALFVLMLWPAAPALAAPVNDNYASRLTIQLAFADSKNTDTATNEAGEPLTPNDPGNLGCSKDGTRSAAGVKSSNTVWWEFTGNGGPITVSTNGSNFDTVLAVYN